MLARKTTTTTTKWENVQLLGRAHCANFPTITHHTHIHTHKLRVNYVVNQPESAREVFVFRLD